MNRPWMPLYVADYLADTGHLSASEHGAYMLLIMHYWQNGGLPADERRIARIARLSDREWQGSRDVIAGLFGDGWRHKRIDAELERATDISSKRKAAAVQRHNKSEANASASAPANAELLHTQSQPQEQASSLRSDVARKRAERLPENWTLPDEWRSDATDAGLPPQAIDLEAAKMRDWSRSSKNGAKLDWRAAWRNWCREAAGRMPRAGPLTPKPEKLSDRANQLARELQEAQHVRSSEGSGGVRALIPDLSIVSGGRG